MIPPDPTAVAPDWEPGSLPGLLDRNAFLYEGPEPIQFGVAPDTITAKRASLLLGTACHVTRTPAAGLRVSVVDHPEFGYSFTREDGKFNLAVNGGGHLTVAFEGDGVFTVHHQVLVNWEEYIVVPDIVVTTMDREVTWMETMPKK